MKRAQPDTPNQPWTTRTIVVGAAVLAAIALVVALGAVPGHRRGRPLVMTAGSTPPPTAAAGQQGGAGAEAAEVQQLVASVRRPPGATTLAGCPTGAYQPIRPLPRAAAATGARCWSVPDRPSGTVAWERRHHPVGMQAAGSVGAAARRDRKPAATGLLFRLGRQGGVELSAYPSGHGSVLRVDGYVRAGTAGIAATAAVTNVG